MSDGTPIRDEGRAPLLERLAAGVIAAALFLPLAFQDVRLEGYETERAGLLLLFAAPLVMIVPLLIRGIWIKSGLVWCVLLLVGAAVLSWRMSISPHTSLEGLPNRGQGLLTYFAYALLFFGALGAGRRVVPFMTPILVAIAIPLCLYALYQRFDVNNPRPGSLLGNANFFASWLILALIWIGAQFGSYRGARRAVAVGTMALIGFALILTGSRGALAALAAGWLGCGLAYAAVTRRRRLARRLISAVGAGMVLYTAIVILVEVFGVFGLPRIFRPVDPFRLEAWSAGSQLLFGIDMPLTNAFSGRDPLLASRPQIGYGLDTIPFLQSRYGVVGSQAYYIDTFHNLGYDALAWTGYIGLAAWIAIYLAAAFAACHALSLFPRGRLIAWFGVHALVSILAAIAAPILLINASPDFRSVMLIGALLGLPLATLIWIGWRALSETDAMQPLPDDARVVIGALGILIAGWIDLQFGFMTIAAGGLWWVALGLLAAHRSDTERVSQRETPTDGSIWMRAAAAAGVLLIAGIGVTMNSQYVRHEVGTPTLLILLASLLGIGAVSIWKAGVPAVRPYMVALVVGVWIVWGVAEYGITQIAGMRADAALTDSAAQFGGALSILALKGIGAAVVIALIWLPYNPIRQRALTAASVLAPAALLMMFGAIIYTNQFRISTQIAIGNTFASLGDPAANALALRLYDEMPMVPDAQFEALNARLRWETSPYVFNAQTERLLANEPYLIGTRRWTLFYEAFVSRFRQPPAYSLNVIRGGTFDRLDGFWDGYADSILDRRSGIMRFSDTGRDPERSAVAYQDVMMDIAAGTTFNVRLDLANSSATAARVGVFIHAPDWSESASCTFVLASGTPWTSYTMRAGTVSAWRDVRFALYIIDGETTNEWIDVDNVELRLTPPLPDSVPSDAAPVCAESNREGTSH
ncbi:MAG: hypothetical protein SGI73_12805 [Chloroflexota bacterium]|nr:hypothetical protein [Chloroflexota bacterium]